ncbi:MAG: ABC transporter permease [Chitinophagales bacterium]|nr:ABC transporter permease [Chitinophagales bacterium]
MAKEKIKRPVDKSYWGIVKSQFRKNRLAVWCLRFLVVIAIIGLLANFLANDKPLYCKLKGETHFPVFKEMAVGLGLAKWDKQFAFADWKTFDYESVVWPLVPYSQTEMDIYNTQFVSPFAEQEVKSVQFKHWMGTDDIGRDVLAGMIHGTRIAMLVGVVSMSISSFLGILLGSLAGYYGDERLKASRISLFLYIPFLFIGLFYSFGVSGYTLSDALGVSIAAFLLQLLKCIFIFFLIMLVPYLLSKPLKRIPSLGRKVAIPVDILISRLIEVIISIPSLLLILSIVALAKPSIFLVMAIIGATSWTGIARFIRGELLRVRNLEYIEAAHALGYSEARTLFKHAIPNALTPVLISIAFGIAGAILVESSLSYLGIGVPAEVITWGKLLSLSRQAPEAWWLAVFPGFAIFLTVTIFNLIGEGLTDALDPRLKK